MMPLWVVVALSIAGGFGAVARYLVDSLVQSRVRRDVPVGIALINLTGSFLIGLVTGLALAGLVAPEWRAILGVGFLGGYTTFSTASFDTVRLAREKRWGAAALNGLGVMVGAFAAAGLGLWVGSLSRVVL